MLSRKQCSVAPNARAALPSSRIAFPIRQLNRRRHFRRFKLPSSSRQLQPVIPAHPTRHSGASRNLTCPPLRRLSWHRDTCRLVIPAPTARHSGASRNLTCPQRLSTGAHNRHSGASRNLPCGKRQRTAQTTGKATPPPASPGSRLPRNAGMTGCRHQDDPSKPSIGSPPNAASIVTTG